MSIKVHSIKPGIPLYSKNSQKIRIPEDLDEALPLNISKSFEQLQEEVNEEAPYKTPRKISLYTDILLRVSFGMLSVALIPTTIDLITEKEMFVSELSKAAIPVGLTVFGGFMAAAIALDRKEAKEWRVLKEGYQRKAQNDHENLDRALEIIRQYERYEANEALQHKFDEDMKQHKIDSEALKKLFQDVLTEK